MSDAMTEKQEALQGLEEVARDLRNANALLWKMIEHISKADDDWTAKSDEVFLGMAKKFETMCDEV